MVVIKKRKKRHGNTKIKKWPEQTKRRPEDKGAPLKKKGSKANETDQNRKFNVYNDGGLCSKTGKGKGGEGEGSSHTKRDREDKQQETHKRGGPCRAALSAGSFLTCKGSRKNYIKTRGGGAAGKIRGGENRSRVRIAGK